MRIFFCLILSIVVVDARVTFAKSEVLDNVDLKGTNVAPFRCSAGCRVFSPTQSDSIVILDASGNTIKSLRELTADYRLYHPRNGFELAGGNYTLKNTGLADPSFVFYAVEKGAANYNTTVDYTHSHMRTSYGTQPGGPLTILSSDGGVAISHFYRLAEGYLPTVYATGFDSIYACRPVFSPRSLAMIENTAFTVNSPIVTINFKKKVEGSSVSVSGKVIPSFMAMNSSAVYVSPGYVGCPNVGNSLYTLVPTVSDTSTYSYLTDSNGINVAINGDYSTSNQDEAPTLTVNDDVTQMSGKNTFSKIYDNTTYTIKFAYKKGEESNENALFAMQVDIASIS